MDLKQDLKLLHPSRSDFWVPGTDFTKSTKKKKCGINLLGTIHRP